MCIVTTDDGIVMGRLRESALKEDDDRLVDDVMEEGPTTTRADESLASLTERLHQRRVAQIIVSDPDGRLIGVVRRHDAFFSQTDPLPEVRHGTGLRTLRRHDVARA